MKSDTALLSRGGDVVICDVIENAGRADGRGCKRCVADDLPDPIADGSRFRVRDAVAAAGCSALQMRTASDQVLLAFQDAAADRGMRP